MADLLGDLPSMRERKLPDASSLPLSLVPEQQQHHSHMMLVSVLLDAAACLPDS
jgi:hypothetical protein